MRTIGTRKTFNAVIEVQMMKSQHRSKGLSGKGCALNFILKCQTCVEASQLSTVGNSAETLFPSLAIQALPTAGTIDHQNGRDFMVRDSVRRKHDYQKF